MYAKIRPRRGTEYEWNSYNPILAEGELAIQFPDAGIGKGLCKFKVGDGVTPWTELAFAFDGTKSSAIDGGGIAREALIQVRSATANAWFNANPVLSAREIGFCLDSEFYSFKIGDGDTRWNELPYIKAAGLIDNDSNFDFGNEEGTDEVMSLAQMENYVYENGNFEGSVFENYNRSATLEPDPEPEPEPEEPVNHDPENPDEPVTPTPVDPENPDSGDDSGESGGDSESEDNTDTEDPVVTGNTRSTAGIKDLLSDVEDVAGKEESKEDTVEENELENNTEKTKSKKK